MTYRGLPYFVTQSSGVKGRVNPYTPERHALSDRVHGVRFSTSPKNARRMASYTKCTTVCPLHAPGTAIQVKPTLADVEPFRLFTTILLMMAIALAAAFAGMGILYGFTGTTTSAFGDDGSSFATSDVKVSTAGSSQSNGKKDTSSRLYLDDPRWAARSFGSETIRTAGSAPLSLALVRIELTGDTTIGPSEIITFAHDGGYADQDSAGQLLTKGAAELGLTARSVEATELSIRREINTGYPVICALRAGSFEDHPTYIMLDRINEHGQLIITDPASPKRSQTPWNFIDILNASTALWSYDVA